MSKYFLVNPTINYHSKEVVKSIASDKVKISGQIWKEREQAIWEASEKECKLKNVFGRVVVRINMEIKNTHKFSDGTVIRRERNYNNLNFREVNPVNAIVISADNIQKDSEILIDYTSIHDSNKIFDYDSGSPDVMFYSIKEDECYAWKFEGQDWQPLRTFEFGLRVFKPYEGILQGIEPTQVKDVIYVTSGKLKGKVVRTLRACDYCIVFQGGRGREDNIIRFRHSDEADFDREEVIGIANDLTEMVDGMELYVGVTASDAKQLVM